jgi:hypothetical protein
MQLRRSARLLTAAGALLLAAPVLTSCGFDYATDRVYTPGAGVNDRDASVDVLSAVVVSAEDGSGTLVASFANNDQDSTATVEDVKGSGDSSSLRVKGFSPIEIPAGGLVNLADADKPINISGDFTTGDFVTLSFTFDDDQTVEMKIPTVKDCFEYEGLDKTADSPTPSDECTQEAPDTEEH